MPRLLDRYKTDIVPKMMERFGCKNRLAVPRLDKIVLNMGVGNTQEDKTRLEQGLRDLTAITGQRPAVVKARKSVAAFKIREGVQVGIKVTLRGRRMYEFLDRLVSVAIPRLRDFRGLSTSSFDGRGNYSLGVGEQLVFPEVKVDDVQAVQGMDITVCTTARTDEEGLALLELFGMPFSRS
ncbi:MAG TPA: 50S ribosomal protein L5 [Planctomycetota bacterium]|nr:50S ribosomal protein L5 [Planctomycetota bacterium]